MSLSKMFFLFSCIVFYEAIYDNLKSLDIFWKDHVLNKDRYLICKSVFLKSLQKVQFCIPHGKIRKIKSSLKHKKILYTESKSFLLYRLIFLSLIFFSFSTHTKWMKKKNRITMILFSFLILLSVLEHQYCKK